MIEKQSLAHKMVNATLCIVGGIIALITGGWLAFVAYCSTAYAIWLHLKMRNSASQPAKKPGYVMPAPVIKRPAGQTEPNPSTSNEVIEIDGIKFEIEFDDDESPGGWGDWQDQDAISKRGLCRPKSIKSRLRIDYCDAKGSITQRSIQVQECDIENPEGYISGFCELRGEYRTFLISRIIKAIDEETGEIIDNINDWANRRYTASAEYGMERLFDKASDALRALFYICKADGRFTLKEKMLFLEFCQSQLPDHALEISHIEIACAAMAIPSRTAFFLLCERLGAEYSGDRSELLRTARAMVDSDKTIKPEELEAIACLEKHLT